MDQASWARVIRFIYQNSSDPIEAVIDPDNPIVSETELDVASAKGATHTLSMWDLIEKQPATMKGHVAEENIGTYPDSESFYVLTEKGFNVATNGSYHNVAIVQPLSRLLHVRSRTHADCGRHANG